MKKFILGLAVAVCATTAAMAEVSVSGGADFVSNYNWRGIQQSGPAIQPGMEVGVGNFTVGAWGSTSFDDASTTTKELDFTVGYSIGGLSISVTDYWWSGETMDSTLPAGDSMQYLRDGLHQQEVTLGYELECGFSVAWSTMIAGTPDQDEETGDQMYSSYLALGYSCEIAETVGCDMFLGFNPWDSQWGDMGLSSIGVRFSKDLIVTDVFTLPVFVETSFSQVQKNAYLVAGMSLAF